MSFDTTTWRKHPQRAQYKLLIHRPDVVIKRRVDQSSFTYPMTEIAYDVGNPDAFTGTEGDEEADQLLAVYDSTEATLKGLIRLRSIGGGVFVFSETSQGVIFFADNDVLVVLDDYRPFAVVPRQDDDGNFWKDYDETYSDQNEDYPPIANAGPFVARDVDSITGKITVEFDASASHAVANGATITGYLWDVADGTITVGTTTTAAITATFPAGQRWVRLRVTDSNAKVSYAVVYVGAVDGSTLVADKFDNVRLSAAVESGWEMAARVLSADLSDVLPGALMIVYTDEIYGDSHDVVNGYDDREDIKFVGWNTNDDMSVLGNAGVDDYNLTALNLQGMLGRIVAFPTALEYNASPNVWYEADDLTAWRAIMHLLYWHTTVPLIADVVQPSYATGNSYPLKGIEAVGTTVLDQMLLEAGSLWALFTVDKVGRCYFRRNPQTATDAEGGGTVNGKTVTITAADYRDGARITRRRLPRITWVRGAGWEVSWTERTPLACIAPGIAPDQGTEQTSLDGRWLIDQDDLNERTGHHYAWNNREIESMNLVMNHMGLPFDPAWGQYVEVIMAADTNRLGLAFDANTNWRVMTYEMIFNALTGFTEETIGLEPLQRGDPATTIVIPLGEYDDPENWPDPPPFTWDEPPEEPGFTPGDGFGSAIIFLELEQSGNPDTGYICRTSDLSASPPTWTGLIGGLTARHSSRPWPIIYGDLDFHDADNAIVFMLNGDIYRLEDWRTGTTWVLLVDGADIKSALQAQFPGDSFTNFELFSACLHIAAAGLFYVICGDGTAKYLVRITAYGTIAVAPYRIGMQTDFYQADGSAGSVQTKIERAGLAPSIDDPDKVYFATGTAANSPNQKRGGYWPVEWGNWLTASNDVRTFLINSYYFGSSPGTQGRAWIPLFDGTGAVNAGDAEQYIIGVGGTAAYTIEKSEDGGSNFSQWTADMHCAEVDQGSGDRECWINSVFETFGNLSGAQAAFVQIRTNDPDYATDSLYVLPVWQSGVTVKGDWTRYDLGTSNAVSWMGGWPYAGNQFYLGFRDTVGNPIIKTTTDPSVSFDDKSGTMSSFWSGDADVIRQKVIRLTPFWAEE